MTNKKISELVAKTTVHNDDMFALVDTEATPDETKKVTGENMKSQMTSAHAALTTGVHGLFARSLIKAMKVVDSAQEAHDTTTTVIELSNEITDLQGEYDSSVKTGTTTSASTGKLIDSGASFVAGDVGRIVYNTTDKTYATVTAVDSGTQLSISSDIMASEEGYRLYFSRFTVKEAGYYVASGAVRFDAPLIADKRYFVSISKNGSFNDCIGFGGAHSAQTGALVLSVVGAAYLEADDYLRLEVYHDAGSNIVVTPPGSNNGQCFLSVFRIH